MPSPTVRELLAEAKALLGDAPFHPPPWPREAHLLLGRVLGLTEAGLLARDRDPVGPADERAFRELLRRRLSGEPVAYLFGEREFYGRPFAVDRRVLVPRPETEHLVAAVLGLDLPADARVLDVGVGSGAIAVTLALERPGWRVVGSDLSVGALALARGNALRLAPGHCGHKSTGDADGPPSPASSVPLAAGDLTAPFDLSALDLLVSNPPYIAEDEAAGLSPEVTEHEPHGALFGDRLGDRVVGGDGLSLIRRLVREAEGLRPGTPVALEIGHTQIGAVRALAGTGPWRVDRVVSDYSGIERVAILRRR